MKKKKILICGASGFIGRNVFERLSDRVDVDLTGTYNTNRFSDDSRLVQIDLTCREQVDKLMEGVEVIIQAAAVTSGAKDITERPYIHITDNEIMNACIFQAAYHCGVKHIVYFSCSVMYPANASAPVNETDFVYDEISDQYFGVAWMKLGREKDCQFYSRLGRTKFTVIRHSNIYGPYDKYDPNKSHVFGANVRKVVDAPDGSTITVWGEGLEGRDLLYVSDLVDFVELAIATQIKPFVLCNAGLGRLTSIRDLIAKIILHSGKKFNVVYDKTKPVMPRQPALDCRRAKDEFGWMPRIDIDSGVQKTITWYKNNFSPLK